MFVYFPIAISKNYGALIPGRQTKIPLIINGRCLSQY
jgi:hypothetical protein